MLGVAIAWSVVAWMESTCHDYEPMKTIIHVNQHVIKANAKNGEHEPPITVKTYKSNTYAHEVVINGPCKLVYRPDKPLSCGARLWIETDAEVILDGVENG